MTKDTPLVLVSNRGPATFEGGEARRGGGGLVTALKGLVHHRDAVWVASAMTGEDVEVAEAVVHPALPLGPVERS
jgi:trehalose 6-phosphate synthase